MTERQLQDLLDAAGRLLSARLEHSPPLRTIVSLLGQWLIEQAEQADQADQAQAAPPAGQTDLDHPPGSAPSSRADAPQPAPPKPPNAVVPLNIGGHTIEVPVHGTPDEVRRAVSASDAARERPKPAISPEADRGIDLALIEKRCQLKAEGCRVVLDRRESAGDPLRERVLNDRAKELIASAKDTEDCFLWMLFTKYDPPDSDALTTIEACYQALARAVALTARLEEHDSLVSEAEVTQAMQMLAQADSALRVALEPTWLKEPDQDQDEVHLWLRHETALREIYVHRHMKLDDPADPADSQDLIEEIDELHAQVRERIGHQKHIEERLKQIRYHAAFIRDGDDDARHLRRIAEGVDELVERGLTADDARIARALGAQAAARLAPLGVESVNLQHTIAAAIARPSQRREEPDQPPASNRSWSTTVAEARTLLEGRSVVIIGGEPRIDAIERIQDAFALQEVKWPKLTEHGSGAPMRAPIEQDDTALVLVLIKLAGHLHAKEADAYARAAGKPCILLPAGYNPEQIADAVMQRASRDLQAGDPASLPT